MDFYVTHEFATAYDALSDAEAEELDEALERLLAEPSSAWARSGLLRAEADEAPYGDAWITRTSLDGTLRNVYWTSGDADTIVFLALVAAP